MVLGLAKGKVQFSKEERRRENTTTNTRTQHAVIETWLLDPLTKDTTNKIINFPWTVMAMQKIFSERAEVRSHTPMTRSVSIVKFQLSGTFRRPTLVTAEYDCAVCCFSCSDFVKIKLSRLSCREAGRGCKGFLYILSSLVFIGLEYFCNRQMFCAE